MQAHALNEIMHPSLLYFHFGKQRTLFVPALFLYVKQRTLPNTYMCMHTYAEYIAQALRDVLADNVADLLRALNDLARCVFMYMCI